MKARIQAIPMSNGDFFVAKYEGVSGTEHVVVLDMGYQHAYFAAKRGALAKEETIDLVVLSHIHDDHIGGALQYVYNVSAREDEPRVREWWFNAQRVEATIAPKQDATLISVRKANDIAAYLSAKYDTEHWKNDIISGKRYDYDGMVVTVLSPQRRDLTDEAPYAEDEAVDIQLAPRISDYQLKVADFDLPKFAEDRKEEHLSCVALLLDFEGKRFLWMADALPSVVCETLREMGYSETNPLECEYMTLSHHGSKGNTSDELLSLLRCEQFVVTGDGNNSYKLPDKESLARVIRHYGEDVRFYATKMEWELAEVFKVDGKYSIEEKSEFEM